ncbi:MAG: SDR family NAD(P)-dependent oxidoreductase [Deltaproteobacteria bacterium]|nr:SDR family NAD(P)-dependent oxidoreductase [Deltaproteobacteria bacterium]
MVLARLVVFAIMTASPPSPIAIVALSCRFPGANDPETFWRLLAEGRDLVGGVPPERWDAQTHFDPDPLTPGKTACREGAFLEQIDGFDWRAFGLSPREARNMDPQHRLLLELAWECFERAGWPLPALGGSRTAVFVGIMWNEYFRLQAKVPEQIDAFSIVGNALAFAANRISHSFDLRGPSLVLDVGCASSLFAVHQACQSLWSGEAELALAGGVNLILTPELYVAHTKAGILSPTGRCRTFDADADGFVPGEGAALVLLKPLARALADGDPIYATILGGAVNHNGRNAWIMGVEERAQVELLRAAYAKVGLDPALVDYVELHGTGTRIGDPVEARALGAVLGAGAGRPVERPLRVGSVKTNLGHLEAAGSMAHLFKVALALTHGELPASLHCRTLNPQIPLASLGLALQTQHGSWPSGPGPRTAGITSLSLGGANAHLVLTEGPAAARPLHAARTTEHGAPEVRAGERSSELVTLSARTDEALSALAGRYAEHLRARPELSLRELAHASQTTRGPLPHRLAVIGANREAVAARLEAAGRGEALPGIFRRKTPEAAPRLAFLFTGQGAQYGGMGRVLYESEPRFREVIDRCSRAVGAALRPSLLEALYSPAQTALLEETRYTQPALYALEAGLFELWRALGVEPAVLIGHSVGEYAAAYAAGVFSLEEGALLVAARGRLMTELCAPGKMAVLLADSETVEAACAETGGEVVVATLNGPRNVAVAGPAGAVDGLVARLAERGVRAVPLPVSHAFHSPMMEPMLGPFAEVARGLTYRAPTLPLVSNLTGRLLEGRSLDADYFVEHIRRPVRFAEGMGALAALGIDALVELGPSPVLLGAAKQLLPEGERLELPSLRKGRDDWETLLAAIAELHLAGLPLRFGALYGPTPPRRVPLPTYAFQRSRLWFERVAPASEANPRLSTPAESTPTLLGERVRSPALSAEVFETRLERAKWPWLDEHRVFGACVASASLQLARLFLAAAELGLKEVALTELRLSRALRLDDAVPRRLQVVLHPDGEGGFRAELTSAADEPSGALVWQEHGRAHLDVRGAGEARPVTDALRNADGPPVDGASFYAERARSGVTLSGRYCTLERLWRSPGAARAELAVKSPVGEEHAALGALADPGALDAVLQVAAAATAEGRATLVPVRLGRFEAYGRWPRRLRCEAEALDGDAFRERLVARVRVRDEAGRLLGALDEVEFRAVTEAQLFGEGADPAAKWLYRLHWTARARAAAADRTLEVAARRWLLVAPEGPLDPEVVARVEALGVRVGRLERRGATEPFALDGAPVRLEATDELAARLSAVGPFERVIWLAPPTGDSHLPLHDELGVRLERLLGPLLQLVRGCLRLAGPAPRLVLVTEGAQAVRGDEPLAGAVDAALWGLGRVLSREHPQLFGALIDLDPADRPRSLDGLLAELAAPDGEDQLALRGETRFVLRLRPLDLAEQPRRPLPVAADGSYLITGGLGGLGLLFAEWLAAQGARQLVLVGRRPPSPEARALLERLRASGVEVTTLALDVGTAEALSALRAHFASAGAAPLRGVIHAAMVLKDRPLAELEAPACLEVLGPKVQGARTLLALAEDAPLDFLWFFSSTASVVGTPGQASYAAANAVLDALAELLRARGLPALSLNYGPWAEVGRAAGLLSALRERWGLEAIPVADGLRLTRALAEAGLGQALLLPADWETFLARLRPGFAPPPLYAEARSAATPTDGTRRATESATESATDGATFAPPASEALFAALVETGRTAERQLDGPRLDEEARLADLVDELALSYAERALAALGTRASSLPDELSRLVAEGTVRPGYRQLLGRWSRALASRTTPPREPALLLEHLADGPALGRGDLALLRETGPRLAEVLRGTLEPRELLFPEGSFDRVSRIYEGALWAELLGELLAALASRLGATIGRRGELRVLELGAGTGATTARLLPLFDPARTHYVFSDVSALFLRRGRERFGRYPFVSYALLDLERDPLAQGQPRQGYDLVVAANVVHATRDLRQAARHLRALLAPGGLLALLEVTRPYPFFDATFGLVLPELADEADRDAGQFLTTRGWRALLSTEGFSRVAAFSDAGEAPSRLGQHVLLAQTDAEAAPALALRQSRRGELDALALAPLPRRAPGPGEVELVVDAAGLNFLDVLSALGMLPEALPQAHAPLGNECAGRVARVGAGVAHLSPGDAVFGHAPGCLATHVVTDARWVVRRPERLSPAEAATMPVVFSTAYQGLVRLARLGPGERLLVHAATGGVGLAALQLAAHVGAEVFATAGSDEKRARLAELGVRHVMSSRTPEFRDQILAATGGRGVDVVLNCLSGELLAASFAALARGGRFVEIGEIDIWSEERVARERPDATYFPVDLFRDRLARPELAQELLHDVLALLERGALRPLPHRVFALGEAQEAFRLMANARHQGKLVLLCQHAAAPTTIAPTTARPAVLAAAPTAARSELTSRLTEAPAASRPALLLDWLRATLLRLLALAPDTDVPPHAALAPFGLDSLLAVELRSTVGRALGLTLPASLLFDYPTLSGLADFLLGKLFSEDAPALTVLPATSRSSDSPSVRALSNATAVAAADTADAVVILGLGCRFPGGASDPEAFWQLLRDGRDAIIEVPADRWQKDRYYDADRDAPGKMVTRSGGFLSDQRLDEFEPERFDLPLREAERLDPQQRLLLEVTTEALEHAGLPLDGLRGSATGVFVGIINHDYATLVDRAPEEIDAYTGIGSRPSTAAGRLSFWLDLKGPNLVVDTACSSSLVAVHLACQSLRARESDLGLAGGVGLLLSPEPFVHFSKLGMLAPDGHCKTFDARADGYVRGEGCGVVVLKRLADAERDGDPILAVLRATAVNQDGRSSSLTAPSGPAQQAVIRRSLELARLPPDAVDFVETHGTGTPLGDPIEVQALAAALGSTRPRERALALGAVKANLGHLEPAAGVAGLLKVVLALAHEELPPHYAVHALNPLLAWDALPVTLATRPTPWVGDGAPPIAGVSAFGWSGTNAHVLVQGAKRPPLPAPRANRPLYLLALSTKHPRALGPLAARWARFLDEHPTLDPDAVCAAANLGRTAYRHRRAVLGTHLAELAAELHRLAEELGDRAVAPVPPPPSDEPPLAAEALDPSPTDSRYPVRLRVLAERFEAGAAVDFRPLHEGTPRTVHLPATPWMRRRCFREPPALLAQRSTAPESSPARVEPLPRHDAHPLLGQRIDSPVSPWTIYESTVSSAQPAYLAEHRLHGEAVLPGAYFCALALAAARERQGGPVQRLEQVAFHRALALPEGHETHLQLAFSDGDVGTNFRIFSRPLGRAVSTASDWCEHATGRLVRAEVLDEGQAAPLPGPHRPYPAVLAPSDFYAAVARQGLTVGPAFQPLQSLACTAGAALGELVLPEGLALTPGQGLHPVLLDGALQVAVAAASGLAPAAHLVLGLDALTARPTEARRLTCRALLRPRESIASAELSLVDCSLFDEAGRLVALAQGVRLQRLAATLPATSAPPLEEHVLPTLEALAQTVRGVLESVVGATAATLPATARIIDHIDSLLAVELTKAIGRAVGLKLPPTLLYQHETIDEVARYLADQAARQRSP